MIQLPAVLHRALPAIGVVAALAIGASVYAIVTATHDRVSEPTAWQPPRHCTAAAATPAPIATAEITKLDATHYQISRSLFDGFFADPMPVARAARIVPSMSDGRPEGFKLYAIKPGSLFDQLGVQNGDTLLSINGYDLTTPDKALELYSTMRSTSEFDVSMRRKGQHVVLHYSISR